MIRETSELGKWSDTEDGGVEQVLFRYETLGWVGKTYSRA